MPDDVKQEIEVKLGDGTVVKGTNLEDAFKNLSEMKVNTAVALADQKRLYEVEKAEKERLNAEYELLKKEKEELAAKIKPVEKPKVSDDNKSFNKDTYFQLLGEDPMKAQDYIDAYRFNIETPDKVRETFLGLRENVDRVVQQVDVFTQQAVTGTFLAQHPEYPQGDADAARLLTQRVNELTSKEGFPYNASTIEFAFFQLVNSDKIKPIEETAQDNTNQPNIQPNPSLVGPGVTGVDMSEVQKAEQMSDADLAKLLGSKGMFR